MGSEFRGAVCALAALCALLALSGCAAPQGAQGPSASERQAADFPALYEQAIEWGECGPDHGLTDDLIEKIEKKQGHTVAEFECSWVTAPLDWTDPENHDTIELAVNRTRATGGEEGRIGTLFGNPGGPGGSGLEFGYGQSASPGFDVVLERYDLFGFDPRGIGKSSPVNCGSALEVSNLFEVQVAICADENPLAHHIGTSQVARDMDLLRHLMGDEQMHYLGYSYGTVVGATYAAMFPETVSRMVLDSAFGPEWGDLISNFDQNLAIAQQKLSLFEGCGTEYAVHGCPITSEDEYIQVLDALAEQPLVASDGTEIAGGMMDAYLTVTLYKSHAGRVEALDTIAAALAGDQKQIDDLAAALAHGGAAVDIVGLVVSCHSFPDDPNVLGLLERIEEAEIPRLLGGPEVSDDLIQSYISLGCDALPDAGDDYETISYTGAEPILVIGITGDHATPFAGAERMTERLGNARLLTLDGHGHAASFTDKSSCVSDETAAYLLEGTLPAEGTVCQENAH